MLLLTWTILNIDNYIVDRAKKKNAFFKFQYAFFTYNLKWHHLQKREKENTCFCQRQPTLACFIIHKALFLSKDVCVYSVFDVCVKIKFTQSSVTVN